MTPTFLGLVPLRFALVLKAHSALVHLVGLDTKFAPKAFGVICRWVGEGGEIEKSKVNTGSSGGAEFTYTVIV